MVKKLIQVHQGTRQESEKKSSPHVGVVSTARCKLERRRAVCGRRTSAGGNGKRITGQRGERSQADDICWIYSASPKSCFLLKQGLLAMIERVGWCRCSFVGPMGYRPIFGFFLLLQSLSFSSTSPPSYPPNRGKKIQGGAEWGGATVKLGAAIFPGAGAGQGRAGHASLPPSPLPGYRFNPADLSRTYFSCWH